MVLCLGKKISTLVCVISMRARVLDISPFALKIGCLLRRLQFFMGYILTVQRNYVKMLKTFHWSFEHFNVISIVSKSISHGKLLSI